MVKGGHMWGGGVYGKGGGHAWQRGHAWQGGVHGGGHVWKGVSVHGRGACGMCGKGGHACRRGGH